MTDQHKDGGAATKNLTPQQMLCAYDAFMGGDQISEHEKQVSGAVAIAASFGSVAYDNGYDSDQATHAMARAFLLALVDQLHPDLDYLRADPASGAIERAARGAK